VFLLGFPLLIIPLAIYNILTFLIPVEWGTEVTSISMVSGGVWRITISDLLLASGLLFLFLELYKATRHGQRAIVDHVLSTFVFVAALVEFLLVGGAATSTFALLMLMCLVDVIAGFTISIRTAQRDYAVERTDMV
jgi:hypothetical protein